MKGQTGSLIKKYFQICIYIFGFHTIIVLCFCMNLDEYSYYEYMDTINLF